LTPAALRALLRRILPILCVLAAGGAIGMLIDGDGNVRTVTEPPAPPAVPAVVGVDGADRDHAPDDPITLDREAREVVQLVQRTPDRFDLAGDLRGEDRTPVARYDGPLATPRFPGCETRFLPTNWSNRTVAMSRVDGIGLHYTAGGNRPGKSDMDGLTAFASSPSAGVSWHFLIDAEGHCYYSVPLAKKAWTIGNLNSQTVNIEVIGRGNESSYPAAAAGASKLRQVVQRLGRVLDIPIRVGAVSNCTVTRPGVITHWQGGPCSGGHHDIRPYDLVRVVRALGVSSHPDTPAERKACASLRFHRRIVRNGGSWQDRIKNHRGEMVLRHRHAQVRKQFLRRRKVNDRLCR
jgi:hypothetical protein